MSEGLPPDPFDGEPSEPDPSPFEGIAFFGDLLRSLSGLSGASWDNARQMAASFASQGEAEPNVDPLQRMHLEELARVAELQVTDLTGLSLTHGGRPVSVRATTRAEWAQRCFDDLRPLLSSMASTLMPDGSPGTNDPEAQLMAQMLGMLAPTMTSMMVASMVGQLATTSLGAYDLPIPRAGQELLLVQKGLTSFAEEWSIDVDDVVLWLCVHDLTHHGIFAIGHVRERFAGLLADHANGFQTDPDRLMEQLGEIDLSNPASLAALSTTFSDPDVLLGVIRSERQRALEPQINGFVAVLLGYVDHVVDRVGAKLIRSHDRLTEALRRRRVTTTSADRMTERLLGLDLRAEHVDRGEKFVAGVIERGARVPSLGCGRASRRSRPRRRSMRRGCGLPGWSSSTERCPPGPVGSALGSTS